MAGCEQSPQTPSAPRETYPAVIRDSPENRGKAEREWRRMLNAYGVAQTPPDLYPVTHTPRSLLGVSGGIQILAGAPEPGSENIALREAVKIFLDRWRDLIGVDPATISLAAADESGAVKRLTYKQANYPFPVAASFGEMSIVMSGDGHLMQLDSRFIPTVEIPLQPVIERSDAAQRVVGRTFTYGDVAGRPQTVRIGGLNEISVKRLVIVPLEKGDSIEVHLGWEVVAGSSMTWTIYIDAINGEDLKVVQNFNT
ncbi:MAG TPA: hypothetical protein VNH22_13105 [Blastocatellia bacterium]|nr:hypothetical protein [Blastocatellia bacterium]